MTLSGSMRDARDFLRLIAILPYGDTGIRETRIQPLLLFVQRLLMARFAA
jgi:hypothetical protein|tara:strand:+ start:1621 stop:1770 length:150 start_codon:yes stop_codon:yes gene_type:complete